MWNFLNFNTFITKDILIFIYYIGLFFMPVIMWIYKEKIKNFIKSSSLQNKIMKTLTLILMFFVLQIIWRMIFEAMIAYFNIHDYLQILQEELDS